MDKEDKGLLDVKFSEHNDDVETLVGKSIRYRVPKEVTTSHGITWFDTLVSTSLELLGCHWSIK